MVVDAVVLLAAVVALLTATWLFLLHGSPDLAIIPLGEVPAHPDFETFWRSAVALVDGGDIYRTESRYPNLNPPLLTLLLAPLGLLEFVTAYRLLVLVTVGLVVVSMAVVATEVRLNAGLTLFVTTGALLSTPLLATLGLGQIYGVLMAGLVLAWTAGRRGHPLLEGVALGLVVAVKPTLAPVLLLPVLRGRWSTVGAAVVTGVVSTAVGVLAAGPASFGTWLRLILDTPTQTYYANASLPGTLARLTSVNEWSRPLAELPGGAQLGLALGLVVLGATAWAVRRPVPAGTPDPALWAITAASLLVSPLSWHNYLLLLMPGLFVLLAVGRWPVVGLALALSLISQQWVSLWTSALPLSLYCGILLVYWSALVSATGPFARAGPAPGDRRAADRLTPAPGPPRRPSAARAP